MKENFLFDDRKIWYFGDNEPIVKAFSNICWMNAGEKKSIFHKLIDHNQSTKTMKGKRTTHHKISFKTLEYVKSWVWTGEFRTQLYNIWCKNIIRNRNVNWILKGFVNDLVVKQCKAIKFFIKKNISQYFIVPFNGLFNVIHIVLKIIIY